MRVSITKRQLKEAVRKSLSNFLSEYRGKTTNNRPLRPITEASAMRTLNRHTEDGYITISSCRGDLSVKDNKSRIVELINTIKREGFSYTPVYGGFIENKGRKDERSIYERSFIVYNRDRNGNPVGIDKLYDFGIEMARRYNQDSFLFKAPGHNPKYIKQDGSIDYEFTEPTSFNDATKEYFTSFTGQKGHLNRFSFNEAYINPLPVTYNERHTRYMTGEIF